MMIVTGPSFTSSTSIRAPKTTGLDLNPEPAQLVTKAIVEWLCGRRLRGVREARAVSLPRLGEQRELADDERRAAGVEQRTVEAAPWVSEDPEARDLSGQAFRLRFAVTAGDADEHEEALGDLGPHGSVHANGCPADALDDSLHEPSSSAPDGSRSMIRSA